MSGRLDVTGVVLAGGLSRRMGGGDKGLLELAGRPMLTHVVCRLRPQVGAMVVNANGDPARFAPLGLPVVPDTIGGFVGPLAGVLAGMRWSAANAPGAHWVVTAPGDAPLLPSWAKEEPAPDAPRITSRPATVVAMDGACRAWIDRTTSMMAAMISRMPMITWIASSGLENMPTDLLLVGAVPYRL